MVMPCFGLMPATTRCVQALVLFLLLPLTTAAGGDAPQALSPKAQLLRRGFRDPTKSETPPEDSFGPSILAYKPTVARILMLQARRKLDPTLTAKDLRDLNHELELLLAKFAEEEWSRQFREWQQGGSSYLSSLNSADRALLRLITLQNKIKHGESLTTTEQEEVHQLVRDQVTQQQWRDWRKLLKDEQTDPRKEGPTVRQFVALLNVFTAMDRRRRDDTDPPTAEQWAQMARRCRAFCQRPDPQAVLPYLLHVRLLEGECELFASLGYYKLKNEEQQLECYERGIGVLDLLLQVKPEHLPPIKLAAHQNPQELLKAGRIHDTLSHQDLLMQSATKANVAGYHAQARHFLHDFCPWGAQLYYLLRDAGLTAQMDWRILPVYGGSDVPDIGPAVILPETLVPVHVREEAKDIATQTSPFTQKLFEKIKWDGAPSKTYMICFLSPHAYDIKMSDIVVTLWKAWVLANAGPGALVEDAVQDYAVAGLGELVGQQNELFATVNSVHTGDNYGFDKSWLLKGKPEFKRGKFAKQLLVGLLQMYEGRFLDRLFSGVVPDLKTIKDNVQDPRSYDGFPMPQVILRSDVHGLERVKDDEYPRAWDIVSFYQLNPTFAAGLGRQYDLSSVVVPSIPVRDGYLRGDKDAQLLTWVRLPLKKPKSFGLRLHVSDFAPMVQVLQLDVLDDTMDKWRESLKPGESLVALLRYTGSREVVAGSLLPVEDWRLTWRIQDERRRKLIKGSGSAPPLCLNDHQQVMGPMLKLLKPWRAKCACWVPLPKTRYIVEFLVCRSNIWGSVNWKKPVAKKGEVVVRFTAKGQVTSGKHRIFASGCVQLKQDYSDMVVTKPKLQIKDIALPAKLLIEGIPKEDRTINLEADRKTTAFRAIVAPSKQGWHKLRIKVGDREFTFRTHVQTTGMGAVFSTDNWVYAGIPVPVGKTKIVVTAENLEPVQYYWNRPEPEFEEQDFERYRTSAEEYRRKLKPPINFAYVDNYRRMQSYKMNEAECHMKLEQYDKAEQILSEIVVNPPNPGWFAELTDPEGMRTGYANLHANANRIRADAAYYRSDPDTLDTAEAAWIAHWKESRWSFEGGKSFQGRPLKEDDYKQLEEYYRRYLSRYLLVGGSHSRGRSIHGEYADCCKRTGMYNEQYDLFKYQLE